MSQSNRSISGYPYDGLEPGDWARAGTTRWGRFIRFIRLALFPPPEEWHG